MKKRLRYIYKKYLAPKGIILMYHRVAELRGDAWELAVTPANFEQHLQVLQKSWKVIPLRQLGEKVKSNSLKRNCVAITFDDGYVDNYVNAMPLLEKYGLPATFFISSGNIGQQQEFWWDELEQLVLYSSELPPTLSIQVADTLVESDLSNEAKLSAEVRQKHMMWKACEEEPPTLRAKLYYKIWEAMKALSHETQQEILVELRSWAGLEVEIRKDNYSMSLAQLENLAKHELFSVEAHTVNHVALACHEAGIQEKEIMENKKYLSSKTGHAVKVLSFPYGNYSRETLTLVEKLDFDAAFTTEERAVLNGSHPYTLGRFMVKNVGGVQFSSLLKNWRHKI